MHLSMLEVNYQIGCSVWEASMEQSTAQGLYTAEEEAVLTQGSTWPQIRSPAQKENLYELKCVPLKIHMWKS